MSLKPCKFFIGNSNTPLDYNQMLEYIYNNPELSVLKEEAQKSKEIASAAKGIADFLRQGKINKPGVFQSSIGSVVWDAALEVAATTIEKGGSVAQAIVDGVESIRNSDWYKNLTKEKQREAETGFVGYVQEGYDSNKPKGVSIPNNESLLTAGKIDKSALKSRLVDGKLPKQIRDGIERNGISYEVEDRKMAKEFAVALISEIGLENAVALAQSGNITGATKTFVLGANVDAAAKANDIAAINNAINAFDESLRAAGREISAANAVYMNSEEGIYAYTKSKVINYARQRTTQGNTGKAVTNTQKQVGKARKQTAKSVATQVANNASTTASTQKRNKREGALRRKAAALDKIRASRSNLTSGGLSKEAIEGYVELGAANIELGYYRFEDWVRRMNRDLKAIGEKLDRKTLTDIWNNKDENDVSLKEQALDAEKQAVISGDFDATKTVKARLISEDGSLRDKIVDIMANETERATTIQELTDNLINELTLQTDLSEQEIDKLAKDFSAAFEKEMTDAANKILDKQFKPKPLENPKKRKSQNDKIVEGIILGGLDDAKFREQFYDKLGLNFVNNPDWNEGLKEMAKYVHNSPEGALKEQAEREMDTYLKIAKNEQYNWAQLGLSQIMNNMLLGGDTMIKALEYNTTKVLIDTLNNLVSNPKNAKFLFQKTFGNKGAGLLNLKFSSNGFLMGLYGMQKSGGSKAETQAEILAKNAKTKAGRALGKYMQLSGKALSSLDLMVSGRSAYTKFSELLLAELDAQNKKLPKDQRYSTEQMQGLVNEVLGNTQEHVADAQAKAEAEIKAMYKLDEIPKKGKERVALNARIIEILNEGVQTRGEKVIEENDWLNLFDTESLRRYYEYADEYGKKNSLVGKPEGSLQVIAYLLNAMGSNLPVTKYLQLSPMFLNAPLNFANFVLNGNILFGNLRLASYMIKGRRGLFLTEKNAEAEGMYGRKSENFNERIYLDERNRLIKKVAIAQTTSFAILALCGFFKDDDDEKEWNEKPFYLTADLTGDYEKADALKAQGLEPFSLYYYGKKVLTWKNSPTAIFFAQPAYIMEKQNFGGDKYSEDELAALTMGSLATLTFIQESSSLKIVSDMTNAVMDRNQFKDLSGVEKTATMLSKNLTSTSRALFVPQFLPSMTKDVQGMLEMDKKKAMTTKEQFFNDLPMLDGMIKNSMLDPFGRAVKEKVSMPSPLLGAPIIGWKNGTFESPLSDAKVTDKYYDLCVGKDYYPSYYRQSKVAVTVSAEEYAGLTTKEFDIELKKNPDLDSEEKIIEIDLSKQQVYDINKVRGEFAKSFIDENYEEMKALPDKEFKDLMTAVYSQGTNLGKRKVLGIEFPVYNVIPIRAVNDIKEIGNWKIPLEK